MYQRAQSITNMSDNLKEEEEHLKKVIQSNVYGIATVRAGFKELPSRDHTDTEQEKDMISYYSVLAGLSESIQRVCKAF